MKLTILCLILIELKANKSKQLDHAITRPSLNNLPENLLQRDPYMDLQKFASEQEKNNYESTRKGVHYSDQKSIK